jgi:hypothetical protein
LNVLELGNADTGAFRVRLLRKGEPYGPRHGLVYSKDEPVLEFYGPALENDILPSGSGTRIEDGIGLADMTSAQRTRVISLHGLSASSVARGPRPLCPQARRLRDRGSLFSFFGLVSVGRRFTCEIQTAIAKRKQNGSR